MVLLMLFEALYFGHFLSFYTMQLEPPRKSWFSEPWMIANMKKKQSTLISVVDADFWKIQNGPSHGTTMCSHHTGQLV